MPTTHLECSDQLSSCLFSSNLLVSVLPFSLPVFQDLLTSRAINHFNERVLSLSLSLRPFLISVCACDLPSEFADQN